MIFAAQSSNTNSVNTILLLLDIQTISDRFWLCWKVQTGSLSLVMSILMKNEANNWQQFFSATHPGKSAAWSAIQIWLQCLMSSEDGLRFNTRVFIKFTHLKAVCYKFSVCSRLSIVKCIAYTIILWSEISRISFIHWVLNDQINVIWTSRIID